MKKIIIILLFAMFFNMQTNSMNHSLFWNIREILVVIVRLIKTTNLLKTKITQYYTVKEGESLSGILNKYYGNTGLNMKIIEISVIEMNKHAFVRNNPHFLYANKEIKVPSLNEIMNLVKNMPNNKSNKNTNKKNHIYFYGN